MPFFINPTAATKSGCTKKDIDVMLWLIPWAYSHTRSYMRPFVEIRHAWYMGHKSSLGTCSDFALIDAMSPTRKEDFNPEKPSKSWNEYNVPKKEDLNKDLTAKIKSIRDLMDELNGTIST